MRLYSSIQRKQNFLEEQILSAKPCRNLVQSYWILFSVTACHSIAGSILCRDLSHKMSYGGDGQVKAIISKMQKEDSLERVWNFSSEQPAKKNQDVQKIAGTCGKPTSSLKLTFVRSTQLEKLTFPWWEFLVNCSSGRPSKSNGEPIFSLSWSL